MGAPAYSRSCVALGLALSPCFSHVSRCDHEAEWHQCRWHRPGHCTPAGTRLSPGREFPLLTAAAGPAGADPGNPRPWWPGDRGHYAKVMWPGSGPSSAHISHLSLCGDRELSQCFLFVVIIVQRPFPLIFTLSAQGGFSPRCLHPYQGGRDTQYTQHVGGFKKWKETIFQTGLLMAIQREASPARPGSAWG